MMSIPAMMAPGIAADMNADAADMDTDTDSIGTCCCRA
jgi:hypothetical protein